MAGGAEHHPLARADRQTCGFYGNKFRCQDADVGWDGKSNEDGDVDVDASGPEKDQDVGMHRGCALQRSSETAVLEISGRCQHGAGSSLARRARFGTSQQ